MLLQESESKLVCSYKLLERMCAFDWCPQCAGVDNTWGSEKVTDNTKGPGVHERLNSLWRTDFSQVASPFVGSPFWLQWAPSSFHGLLVVMVIDRENRRSSEMTNMNCFAHHSFAASLKNHISPWANDSTGTKGYLLKIGEVMLTFGFLWLF